MVKILGAFEAWWKQLVETTLQAHAQSIGALEDQVSELDQGLDEINRYEKEFEKTFDAWVTATKVLDKVYGKW